LALQSGLDQAYCRLQRARQEYDACSIMAPFGGVIGNLIISEGDIVSAGQECCQLFDLSKVNVVLGIIETEINSLECDRRAELEFAAIPGRIYEGQVFSINPAIDEQSKTCRISVRVDNQNGEIKAGMFAVAAIEQKIHPHVLMVPNAAIIERDQRQLLFVVRGGAAKWCYVDTGFKNETCTEITRSSQNLQEGDSVIVSGHLTLVNDSPIVIVQNSNEEVSKQ